MRVRVPSAAPSVCRGARVVECPASQAGDSGIVTRPRRHGVKLDWRTEGGLSSHYRPVRFRLALPSSTAVPLVEVDLPLNQPVTSASLAGGTRTLGDRLTGKAADC